MHSGILMPWMLTHSICLDFIYSWYVFLFIYPLIYFIVSIGCKLTVFNISDCNSFVLFLVGEFVEYYTFLFIDKILGGLFLCEIIPSLLDCIVL